MNLIDPADLPKSAADGPESWGEAFGKLASTTSTAQQMIENTTSDRSMLENIYAQRIAKIADLTGQTLENPIRSDIGVPGFLQPPFRAAYTTNEEAFDKRVQALSDQHPELQPQFQSLIGGVDDEMNRQRREAEQASGVAANNPNLDPISRFTAQMAGGLAGAARDPFQWQMAIAGGGGSSAGSSVGGRIGKTMLSEFMINGGQEAVLQAASQPRKKAAGLEYGLGNALANIGVAGTFGALFGGTIEAGHALAGLYRMGDGGAEIATRVIERKPQPGDVETMANAMGVKLQPQQLEQLNRSFEDRVLDEHMIGPDATPDQQRVFESALRYAEDPDNHPPPEIVERAIADEQAGPARTLPADDYERIYGGDQDAIDDLRDVMQAESLDDAARMIDDQTRVPSAETFSPAPQAVDPYEAARQHFSTYPIKDVQDRSLPEAVYHGTSNGEFDQFDPYAGEYGLMGNGSYFTENPLIALEYTTKGKGKSPAVYQAQIEARNPMDMDGPADAGAWTKAFSEQLPTEDWDGRLISYEGKTNEQMYREVEDALSQEMLPKWEGAEIMQDGLRSMGHDSVTHIGGGRHKTSKGEKHRVWIVFDPEQARVVARERIQARAPEKAAPATKTIEPAVDAVPSGLERKHFDRPRDDIMQEASDLLDRGELSDPIVEQLVRTWREEKGKQATAGQPTAAEPVQTARSTVVTQDDAGNVMLKSASGDAHLSLKREGENLKVGITSVSKASRGRGKARELYEEAVSLADENGGALRSDVTVSNDATRIYNSLSRRGYDVRRNPDAVKMDKGWIAPDRPGENWVFEVRPRPDPGALVDPIEGQTIRPRSIAEPGDAEAMRIAEEQAGAIAEPAIDANGNPKTLFDYIPIYDRDGNVRLVSTSEALEIADQGNILADLLEVCQV